MKDDIGADLFPERCPPLHKNTPQQKRRGSAGSLRKGTDGKLRGTQAHKYSFRKDAQNGSVGVDAPELVPSKKSGLLLLDRIGSLY